MKSFSVTPSGGIAARISSIVGKRTTGAAVIVPWPWSCGFGLAALEPGWEVCCERGGDLPPESEPAPAPRTFSFRRFVRAPSDMAPPSLCAASVSEPALDKPPAPDFRFLSGLEGSSDPLGAVDGTFAGEMGRDGCGVG